MKIYDDDLFSRALWDHRHQISFLALGCKRLRPLAPKLPIAQRESPFDLKCFVHPKTSPRNLLLQQKDESTDQFAKSIQASRCNTANKKLGISNQQPGGTRWNPTHEQIDILEMLYKGGMRTPSAEQIEQITTQLGKYSKIEGKNVFYWFQNHKARERQRYKRTFLALSSSPLAAQHHLTSFTLSLDIEEDAETEGRSSLCKRKSRSWTLIDQNIHRQSPRIGERSKSEGEEEDRTLELFPLHPEGR